MDIKSLQGPGPAAAANQPKFKEVWEQIQSEMGVKPPPQKQAKKTLDKDDFLRIMITQMKNQDPTKPFESDKLAQEIAQIASVEQLGNVSKALKELGQQNKPLERLAMTSLIGKTVTVDRSRFPHSEGSSEHVSFALPEEAASVKVQVIGPSGETVYEKEMGAKEKGNHVLAWDGKLPNTLNAPAGTYMVRVEAKDAYDRAVKTDSFAKSTVMGISYEMGEPMVLVGSEKNPDKIPISNLIKVEETTSVVEKSAAAAAEAQSSVPEEVAKRIRDFEKRNAMEKLGVEMKNDGESETPADYVPPSYQNMAQGAAKAGAAKPAQVAQAPVVAEGFPNGLDFYNEKGGEEQ